MSANAGYDCAAGPLHKRSRGRPPIDDTAHLQALDSLIASGVHSGAAVRVVVSAMRNQQSSTAALVRLRRKRRGNRERRNANVP